VSKADIGDLGLSVVCFEMLEKVLVELGMHERFLEKRRRLQRTWRESEERWKTWKKLEKC
jgi:predicted metal-dependent hydrolase